MANKKMERDEIRFEHNELVKILIEAQTIDGDEDADVMTGPELASALGISVKTLRPQLKRLISAGVIVASKKRIVDIVGRNTKTFGYKINTKAAGD